MDGLRCVVPYSCHTTQDENVQTRLIGMDEDNTNENTLVPCLGCQKNNLYAHNGIYCRIYDWTNLKKSIPFIDVIKGDYKYGKIRTNL